MTVCSIWLSNRQLEWIVLDNNRGLGNEQRLPEGYLREPKSRLEHATVIEHATHPSSATKYAFGCCRAIFIGIPHKN